MTTTRLKRLTLKACRSFVEKTEIAFPERGLVLVQGTNLDTKGSSGAGKSSVLLGLTYAMGHCPFPATAMQSWLTEEPLEVVAEFDANEDGRTVPVVLTRGARTKLVVDGKTLKGSVKTIEEKLRQLIGLPPDLLEALTYRKQKARSYFLSMSDGDKKEFLSQVLGLGKFEEAADEAQAKAKELEVSIRVAENELAQAQALETEHRRQLNALESPPQGLVDLESIREALAGHEKNAAVAREKLTILQNLLRCEHEAAQLSTASVEAHFAPRAHKLSEELRLVQEENAPPDDRVRLEELRGFVSQCEKRLTAMKAADVERRKSHDEVVRGLQKKRADADAFIATWVDINEKMASLQDQLDVMLHQARCPTCKQQWIESEDHVAVLRDQLALLARTKDALRVAGQTSHECDMKLMELGPFEPDETLVRMEEVRAQLRQQVVEEEGRIQQQRLLFAQQKAKRVSEVQARILELKNEFAAMVAEDSASTLQALEGAQKKCDNGAAQLQAHEALVRQTSNRLEMAETLLQHHLATKAAAEQTLAQTTTRLEASRSALESLATQYKAEADFAALVGREGFLGVIFDEVLAEIADEANAMLAAVPNTNTVTLNFRTESSTQKGTVKKSIVPVVTIRGREAPMSSGLSGGMESAVELAVDLAVSTVVSRRTGAVPGWLILDEALEGLGIVEKECCLEILQKFAEDRLVLVVSHDSVFKEMFVQTINVQFRDGISTVKQ